MAMINAIAQRPVPVLNYDAMQPIFTFRDARITSKVVADIRGQHLGYRAIGVNFDTDVRKPGSRDSFEKRHLDGTLHLSGVLAGKAPAALTTMQKWFTTNKTYQQAKRTLALQEADYAKSVFRNTVVTGLSDGGRVEYMPGIQA